MAEASVGVVGAGIVGLATALALRDRGAAVTVYERGEPGHGQSIGETRIFRHAHTDPRLIGLAARAREGWRAWEARSGLELLAPYGVLIAGPAAPERLAALRNAGCSAREVSLAEQAAALPVHAGFSGPVVLDEGGGPVRARRAIEWLLAELGSAVQGAEVLGVDGGEVLLPTGAVRHDAVILCAGPDTPRLARQAGLELPVEHTLHLRCTFAVDGPPQPRLACLLDGSGEHGDAVYASAPAGGTRYAVGLAGPDGVLADGETGAERLRRRLAAYARRALPGVDPRSVAEVVCRVTALPWGDDAFAAWRAGPVLAFAGNNLFKHAPVLGALLADAALGGPVPPELEPAGSAAF